MLNLVGSNALCTTLYGKEEYKHSHLETEPPREKRGCYRSEELTRLIDQMREVLAKHPDFRDEKNMIQTMMIKEGHIPIFLPKFHLELNPIERVWAQFKRYTKAHCKYSLPSLRKNIPLAYGSVSLENIQEDQTLNVCLFGRSNTRH